MDCCLASLANASQACAAGLYNPGDLLYANSCVVGRPVSVCAPCDPVTVVDPYDPALVCDCANCP